MKNILLTLLLASNINAAELNCNSEDLSHVEQDQCDKIEFTKLDNELNRSYKLAIKSFPVQDDDIRKTQEQLRRSQRAWLIYIKENCALDGGIEGGSPQWVSTFANNCVMEEYKKRIKLLKSYY